MKKIKIKFVDIDNSKKLDCFLREKSDWNLIKSCLQKHYEVIETDKDPEYIFCYVPVGNAKGFEYGTYKNAVRCFVQLESVWPNFYSFDYAIGMEHNLAFGSRYLYLPGMIYCNELTNSLWDDVRTKHLNCETELFHRKFCSFTVSNVSDAAEERKKFFQLLSSYKPVDSGGALYNNLGHRVVDKQAFDLEHKFSICFENSWYCLVSDKLPMGFAGRTIPIYWGNPDIGDIFNERAFINCHRFNSFEEVIERVKEIDNNEELYMQMLREPALLSDRSRDEYERDLEEFLVNMVETPRKLAVRRTDICWQGLTARMRLEAYKKLYYTAVYNFFKRL